MDSMRIGDSVVGADNGKMLGISVGFKDGPSDRDGLSLGATEGTLFNDGEWSIHARVLLM